MWGGGGGGAKLYWGVIDGDAASKAVEGIVVLFAWPSSNESDLKPFVELYLSVGWKPLVCHCDLFTLFSAEKATSQAFGVLHELIKELKLRPSPIVFAAFSGGVKGCMYKVLQLIEGKCKGQACLDEVLLIKDSICGQIYDSAPIDFTSDLGTRFVIRPSTKKSTNLQKVMSWTARTVASGLDAFCLKRFEAQHEEYWQALYRSAHMSPFLVCCSEDDEFAPFPVVCNFVQRIRELGGDITVANWISSPHVGHYKHHGAEYRHAIVKLLQKASAIYLQQRQYTNGEKVDMEGSLSRRADLPLNKNSRRLRFEPNDDAFLPRSLEYNEAKEGSSFQLQNPPAINANSVLGQILFDVCVPKNIEEWDIKPTFPTSGRQTFGSARGHGSFNPIRGIRRSRL